MLYKTRLWRETLKNHPQGLLVNTVSIIGMATLVGATAAPWFWQWAALSLALTALRYFFYLHCRRHAERHPGAPVPPYQIALHCAAAVATAVMWSALAWLGIPAFADKDKFSVIIINSALSAGATATLASMRLTGKLYIAILVIPACISLLAIGDGNFQMIAVMGFVFAWVMLGSHENNYKLLRSTLLLTRDKEDLILEMAEKNAAISKSNAELEKIVAVRTGELQFLANRDPLTSLLNRRGFLQYSYPPATSLQHQVMLFIDIDHFKDINDGLGHDWGDLLLQALSRRLSERLGQLAAGWTLLHHPVCRWGGDEFVVCLIAPAEAGGARPQPYLCLQDMLSEPYQIGSRQLRIGVSIGVYERYSAVALDTREALGFADIAASQAKRLGRGRTVFYTEALHETQRRRLALSAALAYAHLDHSLTLLFQPVVNAGTEQTVAYEALLRWNHPDIGPVSPEEFIPIAETSDCIVVVGGWVLERACVAAHAWHNQYPAGRVPKVAVNASLRQLIRPDFVGEVERVLAGTGLAADRLIIEATESVFGEKDMRQTLATLSGLHRLGVEIHLDDFGTGYSSLSRLREFPLDAIKIDQSFVSSLDDKAVAVIEAAVFIARKYGLRVIAEGVEQPAQFERLRALGVDELQGYLFGRPAAPPLPPA